MADRGGLILRIPVKITFIFLLSKKNFFAEGIEGKGCGEAAIYRYF
jgi:hypothetical protein